MALIYIVEDDENIREIESIALKNSNYMVKAFGRASDFYRSLDVLLPDLVLLDVMLPEVSGFELMEYIQPTGTPVIFITAKNSLDDRVKGLRMGAEDYIVKPFEVMELLARVEVVLRRYQKTEDVLTVGDLTIDLRSLQVQRGSETIFLTKKEWDLMLLFAQNPGAALYRETIYERVWGGEYPVGSRVVDLHIQRLRKKIGWEDKLQTVNRVGYRLEI